MHGSPVGDGGGSVMHRQIVTHHRPLERLARRVCGLPCLCLTERNFDNLFARLSTVDFDLGRIGPYVNHLEVTRKTAAETACRVEDTRGRAASASCGASADGGED